MPRRVFGPEDSALDTHDVSPNRADPTRGTQGRLSSSYTQHRPSFLNRWRNWRQDEESAIPHSPKPDRPPIPSALHPPPEVYATPLPTLSMIVLSITMLGEFLSANVSAPFLLFMVEGFGQFHDEADVGYWTGILVSTFFLTQFFTSLLWATVAAKHGSRIVIFIALLGSAFTCVLFGTATSIQQAIAIRLMQGVFAGAIGVARGSVTSVTDPSNEGRAYAILGFCWGLGGVSGAIVGGAFENPAKKWPNPFANIPIFVKYPYLLPCAVAASVTFIGSILSLFLGPDCGPREGAIRLPPEKLTGQQPTIPEEPSQPTSPFLEAEHHPEQRGLARRISNKLSGYFGRRTTDAGDASAATAAPPEPPLPLSSPTVPGKTRTFSSRTTRPDGSAYGYGGGYRSRLASSAGFGRRGSLAALSIRRRRESNLDGPLSSSVATGSDMNFAQRLLMANENAVTNIADLWVAAAINADNEDVFESESELDVGEDADAAENREGEDELDPRSLLGGGIRRSSRSNRFVRRDSQRSLAQQAPSSGLRQQVLDASRRPSTTTRRLSSLTRHITSALEDHPHSPRRFSSSIAPIFTHVGVRTPPAVLEAEQLLELEFRERDREEGAVEVNDLLSPIEESRPVSQTVGSDVIAGGSEEEKEPSLWSQLPMLIIIQYGLLALHATTHDQVFYLYLVSKYQSGGLNLNAGHFSQLSELFVFGFSLRLMGGLVVALMCLAQIAYQFYLYPNIGFASLYLLQTRAVTDLMPPRGRFSHLSMFRIGSLLFIPAYLSVVLFRVFASSSGDGSIILMAALALSTAIRFCGQTFAYTAIAVLLNYMSPPHVVGYANGIAQSIVSLARFFGPVLGGLLWSMSVQDNPAGYPLGFLACSCACALAVAHSFFIR